MAQVGDFKVEDGRREDSQPTWGYATKKTLAKGMLNASLLMSNAAQLKALFEIGSHDGWWYAQLVLIVLSIVLQIIAAIMLLVLGFLHPKTKSEKDKCNRINNAVTGLVLIITIVNIIISGFGMQLTSSIN